MLLSSHGFSFLVAEIGCDDVRSYLAGLPTVDLLYCAPPNPDMIDWWCRKVGRRAVDYGVFIQAWLDIVLAVSPREAHLELGECLDPVRDVLLSRYDACFEQPARYAAPSTARGTGMARTRTARFTRLSLSHTPRRWPEQEDSDAFLAARLRGAAPMVCFDPCMGKGLLSRLALDHGHTAHGIDINPERLKAALRYVEDHHGPS